MKKNNKNSLQNDIASFFDSEKEALLRFYPGITSKHIEQEFQELLNKDQNYGLDQFFSALRLGTPIQYISNIAYFYTSSFYVDKNVLIPRSETEILVEDTLKEIHKSKTSSPLSIVDLGTGSGAIILSILENSKVALDAYALDISKDALSIAEYNYKKNIDLINQESKLTFILSDKFSKFQKKCNIIVTNPPYIKRESDRSGVHDKVHEYEPSLALYLDDNEYDHWFEDLFVQSYEILFSDGLFIMEGHEDHLKHLKILAEKCGFVNVSIIKDYTQRDRFIKAYKE